MSRRKAIRVLLAEDDPVVLEALSTLVSDEPALDLVAAVGDSAAAVEAAGLKRPDVALVDVRMPGGGGAEAARGIRRISPETRVLALSAYDDRATVLEMLEAGVVGYLVKGSSIDSIMDSIEQAADGHLLPLRPGALGTKHRKPHQAAADGRCPQKVTSIELFSHRAPPIACLNVREAAVK